MKAWRDLKKLPRELWILGLSTLVNRFGTMALPFLVLYLTRSLGFSPAEAGAYLAIYGGVALFVGPIAGKLSDRFGVLLLMEISLISSGTVLILFPLAHSKAGVALMTALFALTNESFRPANLALIGELGPPELRKSAFAMSRWAVNLGMSFGPAIGGFLAQVSFPLLFVVDGVTTLFAASILIFSSFHNSVKIHESKRRLSENKMEIRQRHLLGAFASDADFRTFLLGIIPVALVFFQHESTMPLFLVRDLHFPESAYGFLFTINTLLIIAIEIPLNSAMGSWSHRKSMILGSILFGVGFGALSVARTFAVVAVTVVIWTFGEMILFPSMSAFVSDLAPEGRRGEYMGLYMMTFSFAFMLGPWLGTLAYQKYGAIIFWTGTLCVGIISAGLLASIKQNGKGKTP
jgi:MFS family permease